MKQTEIIPFLVKLLKYIKIILCKLYIMNIKTKSITTLFVALVIILAVNPRSVNNIYNSILGRVFLIGIVILFSMNNLTLGLLAALAIIAASNQFSNFVEGMENGTTIGEDNTNSTGTQPVLTNSAVRQARETIDLSPEQQEQVSQNISDLKEKSTTAGVDIESIKNTIMSKESNSIPVYSNSNNSDNVTASPPTILTSSNLEGFRYSQF